MFSYFSFLVFVIISLCSLCCAICGQGQEEEEEEEPDAFDVSLTKNAQGLGITIAGYVGDKTSGELYTFCNMY